MENQLLMFIICITIFIFAKKFFFAKNEPIIEKVCSEQLEKKIQEKDIEVFYKLNTTPIKLSFYDSSIFREFYIITAYKTIVVEHLWVDEPFLTDFSKILYFTDSNNFWIKSPKTKNIVINLRGLDNKKITSNSFKVFSSKEVVGHILLDIFKEKHSVIEKKKLQNIILNTLIFVLVKSDNIQDYLGDNFSKNHDEILIYESLVSFFFEKYSDDFKVNLLKLWKSHYSLISGIYFQNIQHAQEYSYTISEHKSNENTLLRLGNMPKKQLLSIKLETKYVH